MIVVADESVDRHVVEHLRRLAYDVRYVAEMAPGVADETVLALSNDLDALLLTADKDFGELVFRRRLTARGVILLRLAGVSPAAKVTLVAAALRAHAEEMTSAFTVIVPGMVRIRPRP